MSFPSTTNHVEDTLTGLLRSFDGFNPAGPRAQLLVAKRRPRLRTPQILHRLRRQCADWMEVALQASQAWIHGAIFINRKGKDASFAKGPAADATLSFRSETPRPRAL